MKKIAWMTDIHLNFLQRPEVVKFCRDVAETNPDAVLPGGDIGDARTIETCIEILRGALQCPVYFVLGNRDFYHGAIAEVRGRIKMHSAGSGTLYWHP
jgi:predicted MPP superfamily phosphohydrolase